jgi:hypothetical protein
MRLTTKLTAFAVGLTAVLAAAKATGNLPRKDVDRDERHERRKVVHVAELPVPPMPPAPGEPEMAVVVGPSEQVRILTTNRAAFLSLRDDRLVAGLSDSIRRRVSAEMKHEMGRSDGVGRIVENAVRSGVEKLLDKEISVPVEDIEDIDYRQNRIVIVYKKGEPSGLINFETLKGDGDRTILEQFNEADARKLVEAVKVRIR